MLTANDRQRIEHMLDAIDKISEALKGYSYDAFRLDWQKRLVIERLLEIIGEAANHLSPELQDAHPHIPWPQIVGMRNLVSHEYFRIDPETIWPTAEDAIPDLRDNIEGIIGTEG